MQHATGRLVARGVNVLGRVENTDVLEWTWRPRAVKKGLRWQLAYCLKGQGSSCPLQLPLHPPQDLAADHLQCMPHSCVPASAWSLEAWQLHFSHHSETSGTHKTLQLVSALATSTLVSMSLTDGWQSKFSKADSRSYADKAFSANDLLRVPWLRQCNSMALLQ